MTSQGRKPTARERIVWIIRAALFREKVNAPIIARSLKTNIRSAYRDLAACRPLLRWDQRAKTYRLR